MSNPNDKVTIVGAGIIGALEAYFAFLDAKQQGRQLRITVYEKNEAISQTTTANIVPSLTPVEILAVVPSASELVQKLEVPFDEPGGLQVADVANVAGSEVTDRFVSAVQIHGGYTAEIQKRTAALLKLGTLSMQLWQQIYDTADQELQQILREANFNPCHELSGSDQVLHDGYRISLFYDTPNAVKIAESVKATSIELGYKNCKLLTPDEVQAIDPFLSEYCVAHSQINEFGVRIWKDDTVAIFRPGGCLDAAVFLPKFYAYLQKVMGTYINAAGVTKDCFRLKFKRDVTAVQITNNENLLINGLNFADATYKTNNYPYQTSSYVFVPGQAVGTLNRLGFVEPAYAGFAGASLRLIIPVPVDMLERVARFNHCMNVQKEGVGVAWQARCIGDKIFIGAGGTKAFYADQIPNIDQNFANNRNILQLNMMNDVLPQFVSLAFGRDTSGKQLTEADLNELVAKGIATRWVGIRSVTYDGFPTFGNLYVHQGDSDIKVANARTTTHLGSGGVSFGPAAVIFSRAVAKSDDSSAAAPQDAFYEQIAAYSSALRKAGVSGYRPGKAPT